MFLEALIEYRLCLRVRRGGGDFVWEGLCACCKIYRGDYVHVVKFMGVGIMSMLQNSWGGGIMSTYTNLSMGGGMSGGYCPTLSQCALKHLNAPHRESMRYLNVFTTHRCVARCVTGLSQAKFLCHLIKFLVFRFFLFSFRLEVFERFIFISSS